MGNISKVWKRYSLWLRNNKLNSHVLQLNLAMCLCNFYVVLEPFHNTTLLIWPSYSLGSWLYAKYKLNFMCSTSTLRLNLKGVFVSRLWRLLIQKDNAFAHLNIVIKLFKCPNWSPWMWLHVELNGPCLFVLWHGWSQNKEPNEMQDT